MIKKMLTIDVAIGERPGDLEESIYTPQPKESEDNKWRGLGVSDLNPDVIRQFGIEEKKGVVVTDVSPDSAADLAGIIPGDVVLEINKIKANNVSEYQRIVKGLKGNCLVRTQRGYFLIKESEE